MKVVKPSKGFKAGERVIKDLKERDLKFAGYGVGYKETSKWLVVAVRENEPDKAKALWDLLESWRQNED